MLARGTWLRTGVRLQVRDEEGGKGRALSVLKAGNRAASSVPGRLATALRDRPGRGTKPGAILAGSMPSSACAAAWISLIFLASSFWRRGTQRLLRSSRMSRIMNFTRADSTCTAARIG